MTNDQLNAFFDIFIDSVNNIEHEYLRTVYGEMDAVIHMLQNSLRLQVINGQLRRTGERILCYELYHQLRMRMAQSDIIPQGIFLQGELKKVQVDVLLERFGLARLSRNFMPDFVLHTPGNANDHPYVIEVKTDRNLDETLIARDLDKIAQFIVHYHYQRGIFLSTNVSFDRIIEIIRNSDMINNIPHIRDVCDHVYVVVREDEDSQCNYCFLSEVIN